MEEMKCPGKDKPYKQLERDHDALQEEVKRLNLQVGEYRKALEEIERIGFSSRSKDYLPCPLIAGKALDQFREKPNLEPCGEVFDGEQKCLLPKPCRLHTVKPVGLARICTCTGQGHTDECELAHKRVEAPQIVGCCSECNWSHEPHDCFCHPAKRKCVCGCHVGGVGSATACGCCLYPT